MAKFKAQVEVTRDIIWFNEDLVSLEDWALHEKVQSEMDESIKDSFIFTKGDKDYRLDFMERALMEASGCDKALYVRLEDAKDIFGDDLPNESLFIPFGWCAVNQLDGSWEVMETPKLTKGF